MRLIDADELKERMEIVPMYAVDRYVACAEIDKSPTFPFVSGEEVIGLVADAPAADAFEVVRCKGCDYYDSLNDYCHMFDFNPPCDSFYCRGAT